MAVITRPPLFGIALDDPDQDQDSPDQRQCDHQADCHSRSQHRNEERQQDEQRNLDPYANDEEDETHCVPQLSRLRTITRRSRRREKVGGTGNARVSRGGLIRPMPTTLWIAHT
jgi:hypothetical protein